jgi:hypothetical protein
LAYMPLAAAFPLGSLCPLSRDERSSMALDDRAPWSR